MIMTRNRFCPSSLFLTVFFVCFCIASSKAEEIEWHPRWNVGDQFTVELVKEVPTTAQGKAVPVKGRGLLDMSIQEKGEGYYIVHCTYGKVELEGAEAEKNNPMVSKMMNLAEGLCLKMKTDGNGLPQKLTNIDEVVEMSVKAIDLIEEFLKESKAPQAMIEQTIAPIRTMYQKPEMVELTMLSEIVLFFPFCRAKLEQGKALEFDESIPNPFQGEPLPGKASILLRGIDQRTGIALVEYRLTIDKEKAGPILFAAMKQMVPQMPSPAKNEIPQIDFTEKAFYRIDTKRGWPLAVVHTRDMTLNGQSGRVQSLSFKTLEDKK